VEPDRTEQRDEQEPAEARELRRHRRGRAQQDQRHDGQHLFADEQDQEDHPDGEKPGDLAHRVKPSDICPVEARHLDDEVVQQRRPRGEGDGHGERHQRQKRHGPPPERQPLRLRKGDRPEGVAKCHRPGFTTIIPPWRGWFACVRAQMEDDAWLAGTLC
jgi:hypothetical protein